MFLARGSTVTCAHLGSLALNPFGCLFLMSEGLSKRGRKSYYDLGRTQAS